MSYWTHNRIGIDESDRCGCFYCIEVFSLRKSPIKEWTDAGHTALCPLCGIDSVVPNAWERRAVDRAFLAELHARRFGWGGTGSTDDNFYIDKIYAGGKLLSAAAPLIFQVRKDASDGLFYLVDERFWGLTSGPEATIQGLADAVRGEFELLWRTYAEAPDETLTEQAWIMKVNLQQRFAVEEDFSKKQPVTLPVCVTSEGIESKIVTENYLRLRDAFVALGVDDKTLLDAVGQHTLCVLTLTNCFVVFGESACVDPDMFDAEKGRFYAKRNAMQKIWQLEGYLLKEQLFAKKNMGGENDGA